jgi:hypothetical protein
VILFKLFFKLFDFPPDVDGGFRGFAALEALRWPIGLFVVVEHLNKILSSNQI